MRNYIWGAMLGAAISCAWQAGTSVRDGVYGAAVFYALVGIYCILGVAVLSLRKVEAGPPVGESGRCDCQCKKLCSTTGKQVLLG